MNMPEYIEREALILDIQAAVDGRGMGDVVGKTLIRYVKRVPAADVAPVVRCKECRHYCFEEIGQCCNPEWNEIYNIPTGPDDFCSFGQKMDLPAPADEYEEAAP